MLADLEAAGHEAVGARDLLTDDAAADAAIAELAEAAPERLLVLQVTFTDAGAVTRAANAIDAPLCLWAVPEPRAGGRLRLNAFCGLNLAAHALGLSGHRFGWLYAAPGGADVDGLLAGRRQATPRAADDPPAPGPQGARLAAALSGRRIGRIGEHPPGFATCGYDAGALRELAGVEVEALELDQLFARGRAADDAATARLRAETAEVLPDLDTVDQGQLDRSLRLRLALDALRAEGAYDAFAVRCWPETFTDYGGAVCGPMGQMGEARVPCACEADVYGAVTQMLLQAAAEAPVFLADVVDMDADDDTGVVWHCGQAPLSMASAQTPPGATIHSNRRMPLLYQFALRPGRATLARVSQAGGVPKLVLAGAEVLDRPMAFTGTSGTLRFDGGTGTARDALIGSGVEHHLGLVYGEHRPALREAAGALGLPVLELTP